MINIPPEDMERLILNKLFKKVRSKMKYGYAYNMDDLFEVDKLSDKQCRSLMKMLDNHPLIKIDSEFPKKWSKM